MKSLKMFISTYGMSINIVRWKYDEWLIENRTCQALGISEYVRIKYDGIFKTEKLEFQDVFDQTMNLKRSEGPIRFVLCPGNVTSKHDRQSHYIKATDLARLYGLDIKDCEVFREYRGTHPLEKSISMDKKIRVYLSPLSSGNYERHKANLVREALRNYKE